MSGKKEKRIRIVDHRHCKICGRAIPPNKEVCSAECEQIKVRAETRQRRMKNILLIIYVMVFLFFFLILILGGGHG